MKIGIVGYQGSGKSSLFEYLTQTPTDPSQAHSTQMATATIVDPRVEKLCEIYEPKKITQAQLNIVDTPGLNRSQDGNAGKLANIRESGCMILVVTSFGGGDAANELQSFEEDLLLTDLEIVTGRVEKLRENVKRPRPNRDKELEELEALEPVLAEMESGKAIRDIELSDKQLRYVKAFQMLTQKPRIVILNIDDMQDPVEVIDSVKSLTSDENVTVVAFSVSLQLELQQMDAEERGEFCEEMGVSQYDRETLIQQIMDSSGQMLFFTAGEKEVRTWLIPKGATAVDAAGSIHTDLAKGFVRAETMTCDDLFRLGSEREIKANNLMRKEHKDYVIQDGDILHILSTS